MPDCKVSATRFFSERWVLLAQMLWGVSQIDQMRLAKYSLQKAIADIEGSEATMKEELIAIARKVRQMDRATMKNATLQHVKRSRYLRQQLGLMANKRGALERHLDTLNSSELNQQVVNSVRQTSSALKSMGLDDVLRQADGLQIDMEEQMADMHNLQKTLAAPLFDDTDDLGDGLDAELDLLLKDDDDEITACLSVPLVNTMGVVRPTAPGHQAAEPARPAEPVQAAEPVEASPSAGDAADERDVFEDAKTSAASEPETQFVEKRKKSKSARAKETARLNRIEECAADATT